MANRRGKERLFKINAENIVELLFADNSDDEDNLVLDEEDQEFLAEDIDRVSEEVIIEHPERPPLDTLTSELPSTSSTPPTRLQPVRPQSFYGRRYSNFSNPESTVSSELSVVMAIDDEPEPGPSGLSNISDLPQSHDRSKKIPRIVVSQKAKPAAKENHFAWKKKGLKGYCDVIDYNYSKINIELDETGEIDPFEVFSKSTNFDDLVGHIIEQSELYMKQKGIPFQTDPEEFKAFLGICFIMGYHVLPSIRDYWCTQPDLHVPYIANTMTRNRFETMRASLHFSDNSQCLARDDPLFDRAYKVRPLITHFNDCFQSARNPTKQQAVDEHMIKFKGHNIMKQYIKNKPVRWGFKLWCRCDSVTGYLYQFELYTGRKENDANHGLGEGVVISLTRSLENFCCEVFIDNFFNSPMLQLEMLNKKVYLCGTVRADRKYMPKTFSPDNVMKRGDVEVCSANGISCVKWMDNRSVMLLTNFLPTKSDDLSIVHRKQKGSSDRLRVPCPIIVSTYNKYMGGVDLMDQKKTYYELDRRAKVKYYLRIFFDLLDIAINNSHCIFVQLNQEADHNYKALTPLEYRQIIARSLIGNYTSRKREAPSAPVRSLKHAPPAARPQHSLSRSSIRRRCAHCAKSHVDNRTDSMCSVCDVHLCYTKIRNCFAEYHTN